MKKFNSHDYWEYRYRTGGNSGKGSYDELSKFKSIIINTVLENNKQILSVVDYGVGDGNQLSLFNLKNISYLGLDISKTIVEKCKGLYKDDLNKDFKTCDEVDFDSLKMDMAISCDVLYHLVEYPKFIEYLNNLFNISDKFVVIYANDINKDTDAEHVKFRKFTDYIKENFKEWILIRTIKNPYSNLSPSNFYIYEKNATINDWKKYIIKNLLPLVGNKPEGNIFTSHLTNKEQDLMIPKQKNIVNVVSTIKPKRVLEIGFNAGFSSLLMLMSYNDMDITCIDINLHNYVVPCYNVIKADYPNLNILLESSQTALPKLISQNMSYDLIHIDGDHSLSGATNDFNLCLKLSKKGTIIIFDDTNIAYLNELCNQFVSKKIVKDYNFNKIEGVQYRHRILEVL
jgi:predicted O-methyltransferase YrrM/SAM-dependent methyltransferase